MQINPTYLVCTRLSETRRNVEVKASCFNLKGERDWAYFVTGREFYCMLNGRECVRVTPRSDFSPGRDKLVVETCPGMLGNKAADAGMLLTIAACDLEYDVYEDGTVN